MQKMFATSVNSQPQNTLQSNTLLCVEWQFWFKMLNSPLLPSEQRVSNLWWTLKRYKALGSLRVHRWHWFEEDFLINHGLKISFITLVLRASCHKKIALWSKVSFHRSWLKMSLFYSYAFQRLGTTRLDYFEICIKVSFL